MQYKTILLATFLICCKNQFGQIPLTQHRRDIQDIIFDTSGRMISYPSVYVINNTRLRLKVKVPYGTLHTQLKQLETNLIATKSFIEDASVAGAYGCFFSTDQYGRFQKELDDKIKMLQNCSPCELLKQYAGPFVSDEFIPLKSFLYNIIQHQYEVRAYKGSFCVQKMPLEAQTVDCRTDCIYYQAKDYKKISEMECSGCTTDMQPNFRFELVEQAPWNATIRDWYQITSNKLLGSGKKPADLIDDLKKVSTAKDSSGYKQGDLNIRPLKEWFLSWLWFTKGSLTLDPFNLPASTKRAQIGKQIDRLNKQIDKAKEEKRFLDSAQANLPESLVTLPEFREIRKKEVRQQELIQHYTAEKATLQKQLASNKTIDQLTTIPILYKGQLVVSSMEDKNPLKQFDAAFQYRPVNSKKRQLQKVTEVPENEKLQLLVHNIGQGKQIRFNERSLPFSDQEEFTTFVKESLSAINISSSVPSTAIGSLQDFVRSFIPESSGKKFVRPGAEIGKFCEKIQPYLADIIDMLNEEMISFPPDPALFTKLVESEPKFHSELKAAESFEAPYRDSINIREVVKDVEKDVAKTFIKVGKLRFIEPAAGLAITRKPVTVTTIDTARGSFAVNTADNRAVAMVGFKLYPFRNFKRDHGIVPRYFLRRFSGFGGFELLHPRNNFYVGGAYDVVPGLSLMAGNNFYLRTGYKVQNNAITGTSRSYKSSGLYYAVTVNPVLFVEFVKLIFR